MNRSFLENFLEHSRHRGRTAQTRCALQRALGLRRSTLGGELAEIRHLKGRIVLEVGGESVDVDENDVTVFRRFGAGEGETAQKESEDGQNKAVQGRQHARNLRRGQRR